MNSNNMIVIMKHASVFSGIGGPEVAASMLGWENVFHCDINKFGRKVLEYHYPNSVSYEDITKTDFSEWEGKVDVLTGGFPCQPFSYAGKRRGSEDDRYLWPYMLRCIEQVRPTWFVGENVAGITTMAFPSEDVKVGEQADLFGTCNEIYEKHERYVLNEICENLERAGYSVQPMLIPACAVGAPHRRDRVFIVARRCDKGDERGEISSESNAQHDGGRSAEYSSSGRNEMQNNASRTTESERRTAAISSYTESEQGRCRIDRESCKSPQEQPGGRGCEDGVSSYAPSQRRREGNGGGNEAYIEREDGGGRRPLRGFMSDTCCVGLERELYREINEDAQWKRPTSSFNPCDIRGLQSSERWRNFPSVSPVYRGNDGVPFPVGSLTIPFPQWKEQSLKAYGNAIVPQVMYEIFRCIDEIEKTR